MAPREYRNTSVPGRAWSGLMDFFSEFTGGPGYKKTTRTKALKTKIPKRAKLVTIKPEPKELKREQKLLKEKRPVEQFEKDPNWNSVLKEEELDYEKDKIFDIDQKIEKINNFIMNIIF